jgi:anti-sigma B factor antagonist
MNISRKKNKDHTLIRFEGELTIYTAAQTQQGLFKDHEKLPLNVGLDLQAVSEIDTAGLQILLLLQKVMAARGGQVFIAATNETIEQVFTVLDLHSYFALAA